MTNKITDFFKGKVTFAVGDADTRIVNKLRKFRLSGVTLRDGCLRFSVTLAHKNDVIRTLGKKTYTATENANIFKFINVFYVRPIFAFSLVAAMCALTLFNNFVFSVRVTGLTGTEQTQVTRFLADHGIKKFTPKSAENAAQTARTIVAEFDFVAHANAQIIGSALIFNIYRAEVAATPTLHTDLISTHDAVVSEVIVISGTSHVTPGDVVRKGETLVLAQYQQGEGIFKPTRAVARIMGDVKYSKSAVTFNLGEITALGDALIAQIVAETGIAVENFTRTERFIVPISKTAAAVEIVATLTLDITK